MKKQINRRSKRHIAMVDALKEYLPSIRIVEEYYLDNRQFLDIYLPDFSCGIEIDGEFHSHYLEFFHGKDNSKFRLQKFLDSKKYLELKKRGIFLYRVLYSDNRDFLSIVRDLFCKLNSLTKDVICCNLCGNENIKLVDGYCIRCLKDDRRNRKMYRTDFIKNRA